MHCVYTCMVPAAQTQSDFHSLQSADIAPKHFFNGEKPTKEKTGLGQW